MDTPFDVIMDSDADYQDVEDFDDVYYWPEGAPGPQATIQTSDEQENNGTREDGTPSLALDGTVNSLVRCYPCYA